MNRIQTAFLLHFCFITYSNHTVWQCALGGNMPQGQQIGYIRVSSADQNTARQLQNISLDKVFEDKCSGKDTNRPQLKACLVFERRRHAARTLSRQACQERGGSAGHSEKSHGAGCKSCFLQGTSHIYTRYP